MINLLPPYLNETRQYGRRNISLLGYSGALVATAIITVGIMGVSLRIVGGDEDTLRHDLEDSTAKIANLEKNIKNIEAISDRLDIAKKISDQSVSFSELIPQIGAVLPDGVVLNALSLDGGVTGTLQLDVDLLNAGLAPIMIRNLVESDLFEAADISTLSPRGAGTDTAEAGAGPLYNFTASITASFTGTAEASKKAAAAEAAKKAAAAEAAAKQAEGGSE